MVSTPNTQGLYGNAATGATTSGPYVDPYESRNQAAANTEWQAVQDRAAAAKKAAEEKAAAEKKAAEAAAAAAAKAKTQPRNILAELAMRGGGLYPGAYGVHYAGGWAGGGGGGGGGNRSGSAGYGSSSSRASGTGLH